MYTYFKQKRDNKVYKFDHTREVVYIIRNGVETGYNVSSQFHFDNNVKEGVWLPCKDLKLALSIGTNKDHRTKTITRAKFERVKKMFPEFKSLIGSTVYYDAKNNMVYREEKDSNGKSICVRVNLNKHPEGCKNFTEKLYGLHSVELTKLQRSVNQYRSAKNGGGVTMAEAHDMLVDTHVEQDTSGAIKSDNPVATWTDKHYDFTYKHTLSQEDIDNGYVEVKVDPYFVNRMWKINSWDDTGAAFHSLKNYARICNNKNPLERDILSLYKQVKRLCELHGVEYEDK